MAVQSPHCGRLRRSEDCLRQSLEGGTAPEATKTWDKREDVQLAERFSFKQIHPYESKRRLLADKAVKGGTPTRERVKLYPVFVLPQ